MPDVRDHGSRSHYHNLFLLEKSVIISKTKPLNTKCIDFNFALASNYPKMLSYTSNLHLAAAQCNAEE